MIQLKHKFYLLILPFLALTCDLMAQPESESPYDSGEPATRGAEGDSSTIFMVVGVVVLLAVFILLRKQGSGRTRAGNPK